MRNKRNTLNMKFILLLLLMFYNVQIFAQTNFNLTWFTGCPTTYRSDFLSSPVVNSIKDLIHNRRIGAGGSNIFDSKKWKAKN